MSRRRTLVRSRMSSHDHRDVLQNHASAISTLVVPGGLTLTRRNSASPLHSKGDMRPRFASETPSARILRFSLRFLSAFGISLVSTLSASHAQTALEFSSETRRELESLPPWFMIPKTIWAEKSWNDSDLPHGSFELDHPQVPGAGLRLIPFLGSAINVDHDQRLRASSAESLAAAGVLRTGDVILTFRPETSGQGAFAEYQLGTVRAAITLVAENKSGKLTATNVELPAKLIGHFNAPSYYSTFPKGLGNELRFFHVLRPNLSESQRVNVGKWLTKLKSEASAIEPKAQLDSPRLAVDGLQLAHDLARIAAKATSLEEGLARLSLSSSELVYGILALASCDPDSYDVASSRPNACVAPPFTPLPALGDARGPGYLEGPETLARAAGLSPEVIADLVTKRALAPSASQREPEPELRAFAESFSSTFSLLRLYHQFDKPVIGTTVLNTANLPNVTPASFLIQASGPQPIFSYIGTVYYRP